MERSIGLAFTTLTTFAPLAHPAHSKQTVATDSHPTKAIWPAGSAGSGMPGDCMAAGGLPSSVTALALLGVLRRRRR